MFVGVSGLQERHRQVPLSGRRDKHKARLWNIFLESWTADVAEAQHALGVEGDDITTARLRLSEAHAKSNDRHLPKKVAEDIVPGRMQEAP